MKTRNGQLLDLHTIKRIMTEHSQGNDASALETWLNHTTLCRFRDWVPRPVAGEQTLLDIGCYQPSIGYYFALGWSDVIGIAKEEGEVTAEVEYGMPDGSHARIAITDIETEPLPVDDDSVDAVIMMEVIEHFALDPMHALVEINRVLRPDGRLILTTPNATSYDSLTRLITGRCPYGGLQFSGYSTNRHNRLYDCFELESLLHAAGFSVDVRTHASYLPYRRRTRRLFEWLVRSADAVRERRRKTGGLPERGDYLVLQARKSGPPLERYPQAFYFQRADWPQWYSNISTKREGFHTEIVRGASECGAKVSG